MSAFESAAGNATKADPPDGRLPRVVSVVLNTNRRDDTLECLASLARMAYANHLVIVLDNHSTDGSVEAIRALYPQVHLLQLTENLGYAGNNNAGIRAALDLAADWVFVLNEDTVLDAHCLAELVQVGESDLRIGIVGPTVYHHNEPDVIQSAGARLDEHWLPQHLGQNEPERGQFAEPRSVDYISGCAILVRRAVIEQVGALDERFFYYFEETEWCVRAARAGWKIVHAPAAKIWHKGVQRDYRPGPSVTYYSTRNRLMMLAKHHAPLPVRLHAWASIARTAGSWSIKPRWRAMRGHRDAMLRGAWDFLRGRSGPMPGKR